MPRCIYCLDLKLHDEFTNIEHVIPQSFGTFDTKNPTLIGAVCNQCNQFFGDNLETQFARDSLEGGLRFSTGLKAPREFKSMGKRSSRVIKIATEGCLKGSFAYLSYGQDVNDIITIALPQVGVRQRSSDEREWFRLDSLPEYSTLSPDDFDLEATQAFLLLGATVEEFETVGTPKGWKLVNRTPFEPNTDEERMLCEVHNFFGIESQRVIAKIAFNYLAFHCGHDFALRYEFDEVRRFIRYGDELDSSAIAIGHDPILGDEIDSLERIVAHIITLESTEDGRNIWAQVSLFNQTQYLVGLGRNLRGRHIPFEPVGLIFDPHSGKILDLELLPAKAKS